MDIHINKDGRQHGPYTLDQVNEYLAQGSLQATDPAWHEGLAEWVPLNQVGGIVVPAVSTPPPFDQGAFGTSASPPVASSPPPAADPPMEWHTSQVSAVCPQCNVTVPQGQVVCMNCGSHLHAMPSAGKKGVGKLVAIIGGGVLTLGVVAVVIFYVGVHVPRKNARAANRLQCANNLSQIHKAMYDFSDAHEGCFPWHILPEDQKFIFGKGNPEHLGTIFALDEIRESLGSPNILRSPCDPDREAIADFKGYSARENKPIPHAAISYGLCPGGDYLLGGDTILGITRNVSGADLKGATFLGNVMEGLEASQGQYILSDGGTVLDDARLKEHTLLHTKARGGIVVGPPSTKIWLPK